MAADTQAIRLAQTDTATMAEAVTVRVVSADVGHVAEVSHFQQADTITLAESQKVRIASVDVGTFTDLAALTAKATSADQAAVADDTLILLGAPVVIVQITGEDDTGVAITGVPR